LTAAIGAGMLLAGILHVYFAKVEWHFCFVGKFTQIVLI